jgi:hypothetical protein
MRKPCSKVVRAWGGIFLKVSDWGRDISLEARGVMAVCTLTALTGALLYHEKWAKPWTPNIVVGALTIGLTATIVETLLTRAQRRAASKRVQPVLEVALRATSEALYYFLRSAANSYASSNLTSFHLELPPDVDGWLSLLIDELPNTVEANPLLRPGISPVLLTSALRDSLDAIAARDGDVLLQECPELLAAMHTFHDQIEVVREMDRRGRLNIVPQPEQEILEAMSRALMEIRDFAAVYAANGPPVPAELIEDLNGAATRFHTDRLQVSRPLSSQ